MEERKSRDGKYVYGLATGFLIAVLVIKLAPVLVLKSKGLALPFIKSTVPTSSIPPSGDLAKVVLPEKYNLGVSLNEAVVKMIELGVIDKKKFLAVYEERGGLTDEEKKFLESPSTTPLTVDQKNSALFLNLLWPLGIANRTKVLSEGPMGTKYKDEVASFASTGGWTLGREEGGKLFNRFTIVKLTDEQENLVKEIAENIYRPCCGNSTYFPDCNHGAAMLGFLELAVSQGLTKDEIYKEALILNSYWFPQTYIELATYFKAKKGLAWEKVSPKEVLGAEFSGGQGSAAVNKELRALGILPEVKGGGSCGV